MELIVDASILFSFFKPDSDRRELLEALFIKGVRLIVPEYGLDEIFSLKEKICKYCGITEGDFSFSFILLLEVLEVIPEEEYKNFLPSGKVLLPKHPKDAPYFALALSLNIPIWSDEKRFKTQSKIKVLNSEEISKLDP